MAIIAAYELFSDDELCRSYCMQSNSTDESILDIIQAAGMPQLGEQHPDNANAVVDEYAIQPHTPGSRWWHVHVVYGLKDGHDEYH